MLDINFIREHPNKVKENIKKKFQTHSLKYVDEILKIDKQYKKELYNVEQLKHQRNLISKNINQLKKQGKSIKPELEKAKQLPKKIFSNQEKADKLKEQRNELLSKIPNLMSSKVPKGKDESKNKTIKKQGKISKFTFPVKTHVELAENLKLADFEASAKVSGNGFYYLRGDLALLNQALIRFAIDFFLENKKDYKYIETPLMLNEKEIYASMDKNAIEESVYKIEGENKGLIGTSEQSLLAMYSDCTLTESKLPKKYFSYSMCFRKEIGAHGINEKGLWRTHQFNKIEQFIFCTQQQSEKLYDELLKNSEQLMKKLKLPYRVVEICSGDLADWKYRSADIEVYRPTTKDYGEVASISNCTDYQARKLNIRYTQSNKKPKTIHTLNSTALATSRIMVAILENNQTKQGTIKIPAALQKYMQKEKFLKPKSNKTKIK